MSPALAEAVLQILAERAGRPVAIVRELAASGGCINSGTLLFINDKSVVFLKHNGNSPAGFFHAEAAGLCALAGAGGLRIPRPISSDDAEGPVPAFLLLEGIQSAPPAKDFDEQLGRGLAQLHRATAPAFGFDEDNFIGSTPQSNPRIADWPEFFATARLEPMLRLVEERGRSTPDLAKHMSRLIGRLPELIGRHNPVPSLVHGDLWSGNVMSDEHGAPVIFDPAAHDADREVDIAMTELFGRFAPAFYAAYREAWPLSAGYEVRRDIYNLYHLLNHVYIFGLSYMTGAMGILRRYT